MRIVELETENFRKFQGTHRVTGFQPGLNLISGPNEMGKSTLLAALKAALFERHRSKAEAIKTYQTDGHDLAPMASTDVRGAIAPCRRPAGIG